MKKSFVLVKHDVDTSKEKSSDGDGWIHYWKRQTHNNVPEECPCCGEKPSDENPMVGAHVVKILDLLIIRRKRYITPTCKGCNDKYKGINAGKVFRVLSENLLESPY